MSRILQTLVIVLLAILVAQSAYAAAEPLPGDTCTAGEEDNFLRSGGKEIPTGHFIVCKSGTWRSILSWDAAAAVTKIGNLTCTNGQILKFNGTTWACAADDAGALADNAVTNAKMADDAIGIAELSATGTASATTYLRGDNTWATITGGDNLGNHTATANINLGTTRYLSPDGTNVGLTVAAGGTVNASGSLSGFGALPRDSSGDSWVFYNPTGDDMRLWRTTGGDALTILQNGNLGIGTAAPTQKLHLNGNAFRLSGTGANGAPEINLDNGTEFLGQSFQLRKDFSAKWVLKSVATGNDLGVFVDNNELRGLSIKTGTGNVGIGIAAPTEKLDVAGTIKATNFVGSGAGLTGITGDNLGAGGTTTGRISSTGSLPASQVMATATGGLGAIEARSQGTSGTAGAAFMSFHRPSAFAAYFGLDTDNKWKVGGWSMGANSYEIFHQGKNVDLQGSAVTSSAGTVIDANGGWHRTYGNTGWYNGTYAGGWYMQDTTYIRNYGSKQVYLNADITAPGYNHTSDARLKQNIVSVANPVKTVMELRGVRYEWIKSGKPAYGFIAQEVETVLPEAVTEDAEGMMAVEYDQIIAPLLEAVKAQELRIQTLELDIRTLRGTAAE